MKQKLNPHICPLCLCLKSLFIIGQTSYTAQRNALFVAFIESFHIMYLIIPSKMIKHGYQEILIELKRTRKLKGKRNEHIGSKLAYINKKIKALLTKKKKPRNSNESLATCLVTCHTQSINCKNTGER